MGRGSRRLLSGICGSDLATVDGRSSRYFEELVSFPFVPGHEVVGTRPRTAGAVVLEPVLGCAARRIEPPCAACAEGRTGNCERVAFGHLRPGLQTGFCADTGGGWSTAGLVAHPSQLHTVPDDLGDEDAVTIEPVACAVHAVLAAGVGEGETVAVLGAGTLGLAATAALGPAGQSGACPAPATSWWAPATPTSGGWPPSSGATEPLAGRPAAPGRAAPSGSLALGSLSASGQRLTGGADVVLDCVGSRRVDRPVPRHGPPPGPGGARRHARSVVRVDLASLWHREVTLAGRLRLRRRDRRRRGPGAHLRPGHRGGRAPPASAGWCRPPTPSTASRRRWPTPAPPGGGGRSRWPSTCARTVAARPRERKHR